MADEHKLTKDYGLLQVWKTTRMHRRLLLRKTLAVHVLLLLVACV